MARALFDLDHTLLGHDCQALFANWVLRRQPGRRWKQGRFVASLPLRALKRIDTRELKARFHGYLGGVRRAELDGWVAEFVSTEVLPRVYPEVRAEVDRHRREGREPVLVSASPGFYVERIAAELGFADFLATDLVLDDPVGRRLRIQGENNKREAKITALQARGVIPADWQRQRDGVLPGWWAYSDSPADLPMLRAVEFPVAVHPKPALAAVAAAEGWPVLDPAAEPGANSSLVSGLQAFGLWKPSQPLSRRLLAAESEEVALDQAGRGQP